MLGVQLLEKTHPSHAILSARLGISSSSRRPGRAHLWDVRLRGSSS